MLHQQRNGEQTEQLHWQQDEAVPPCHIAAEIVIAGVCDSVTDEKHGEGEQEQTQRAID